ncbi:hypothetical protein GCM10010923_13150 [Blastomonas marina]|uniref:Lipoprotein n=1 Tax=Blastomonas marina TaxID=1867408 RepID=A0ABQ1FAE0_9SPHN|nr:hypothetical protein [Blastomonas marina]GGA04956.1 hypothetical protein GCM10010923_13150 [Blastomonas marina]
MIRTAIPLAACAALALAACAEDPSTVAGTDETDLDNVDTESEREAAAAALEAGDFANLELGAKIVGPQGPEVKTTLSNDAGIFADITSYVACPAEMSTCDPATAPRGTVYTYVHIVYPGEDNDPTTGAGDGADSSDVERATLFRMNRPATGFTGTAGYAKAEALAAIGEKADIVITCDDGALAWTISAGDGGNQWEASEPLTFYWQSTVPPAGPASAYAIDADGIRATGDGPYPGDGQGSANACLG